MTIKTRYTTVSEHRDIKEYFKDRLEYKINVYDRLAFRQKRFYLVVATLAMLFAALVPVLIANDSKLWATILSVAVTVFVGIQSIFHPREHWRNYDLIAAMLRREEMLFSTGAGEYENLAESVKRRILVRNVENLIAKEREETIVMRTTMSGQTGDENNDNLTDPEQTQQPPDL